MQDLIRHALKIIVLLSFTFVSCADNAQQEKTVTEISVDTTHSTATTTAAPLANIDTLIVDRQAVVFIEPDSIRTEQRKKEVGEENFYAGADDYLFYMSTAHEFLDSAKLTSLDTRQAKYIKFIQHDKSEEIIRLDKLPELWSIYFFDPAKKATQVDMTIIDEEYKSYFK